MLVDWADRLKVTECSQVYKDSNIARAFSSPTVGDVSAIMNGIGMMEHSYPVALNFSSQKGTKAFFLDPHRESNELLRWERPAPDDIYWKLGGLIHGKDAPQSK